MKTIIRLTILLTLFFILDIVYKRFDSYIMLPIITFILIFMNAYDFFTLRINLKTGKAIRLGEDSSAKWSMIIGVVGGLVFFILGFRSNYNDFAYWGINSTSYLGLFFISMGLTVYQNFSILLNDKYLKYKDFWVNPEVRYKKIRQIIIEKDKITITTKRDNIDYEISNGNQRLKLIDFLRPRLEEKLIVNE